MKIILAPDKFRGSLTASQACEAMAAGVREACPEAIIQSLPLSDGGEGFLETLVQATQGTFHDVQAHDPLMRNLSASYGISGDRQTAFIEMATVSGLALLNSNEYQATQTSTYGTGELLKAAIQAGVSKVILGIGGSATTDGGMGMAQALGWQFFNEKDQLLEPTGASLILIHRIEPPSFLPEVELLIASDVTAPLFGATGAAQVYGPQKGASPEEVALLDKGLQNLAQKVAEKGLGISSLAEVPGAGAAGGLGFGLMAFAGAKIRPGAALVMELTGFQEVLSDADLILTGEGKLDEQSLQGKLIGRICETAQQRNIPVLALCGTLAAQPSQLKALGLSYAASILRSPVPLEEALQTAAERLREASFWAVHLYCVGKKLI
ncbi:glycerate kinase [Siphonobacter sp. SORGH_AS_0500]|uniref:glycerate kinase n=1 Tax=Siphonobacter sp. SORGH_AS_0500 TaxID=1864824 RepID=UPI000D0FC59E|nr:glycerate kinase [Siphonobacter sp. SORGH_AS_0500]